MTIDYSRILPWVPIAAIVLGAVLTFGGLQVVAQVNQGRIEVLEGRQFNIYADIEGIKASQDVIEAKIRDIETGLKGLGKGVAAAQATVNEMKLASEKQGFEINRKLQQILDAQGK